jgi:hypothetical protein
LYGWETWSLTFREESRVRVFVNGVMRRIFGPKSDEVDPAPNVIRVIESRRMGQSVFSTYWRRGEVFTGILVGKPEEYRRFGKLGHR